MSFHSAYKTASKESKFNSVPSKRFLECYESKLNDSLVGDLNDHLPSKTFAPSSLRCKRIQWFRLRGTVPDDVESPDVRLNHMANVGTFCHENIQALLSNSDIASNIRWVSVPEYLESHSMLYSGYSVSQNGFETKIQITQPPVNFSCDGIVEFEDVVYLLEIKTSEYNSFKSLTGPKPQHVDQILCYCTLMNIYDAMVMYQDRQYGDVKCFTVHVSESDKQGIIDTIDDVMEKHRTNICPEPLPEGDRYCNPSYCRYYHTCKNQY